MGRAVSLGDLYRRIISIHPPREGWDDKITSEIEKAETISIHPPREGWDICNCIFRQHGNSFQSTHPVRGGTEIALMLAAAMVISIHPPREGWDRGTAGLDSAVLISIHPPREGWD